jgi:Leucine-rich repeat (LRR) protein
MYHTDDNNLVGFLPSELSALIQLETISYFNNTMVSGEIPQSYGSLPSLQNVDVNSNAIRGSIPNSICNATMLEMLNFKMNTFMSTIPTCIGALKSLTELSLDRNMFTGTLPTQIGQISALGTSACEGSKMERIKIYL